MQYCYYTAVHIIVPKLVLKCIDSATGYPIQLDASRPLLVVRRSLSTVHRSFSLLNA